MPLRLAAYVSATRSSSFATCGKSAMRYGFTSGSTITETRVDGSRCADAEVARTVFCQSSGAPEHEAGSPDLLTAGRGRRRRSAASSAAAGSRQEEQERARDDRRSFAPVSLGIHSARIDDRKDSEHAEDDGQGGHVAGTAKPYVDRALNDEELRDHVKQAYAVGR